MENTGATLTGKASVDKPWLQFYPEALRNVEVPTITVETFLRAKNPDENKIAFEYYGNKITWKEFWGEVDKAAKSLKILGFGEGNRIPVFLQSVPAHFILLIAAERIGAAIICRDDIPEELCFAIRKSKSETAFVMDYTSKSDEDLFRATTPMKRVIKVSPYDYADRKSVPDYVEKEIASRYTGAIETTEGDLTWDEFLALGKDYTEDYMAQEDVNRPVFGAYTSGSTGISKLVIHSSSNIVATAFQMSIFIPPSDVPEKWWLPILPPALIAVTVSMAIFPLSAGLIMVLDPFCPLEDIDIAFMEQKPNFWALIPMFCEMLMKSDRIPEDYDMSHLRSIGTGAEAMNERKTQEVEAFFHKHNVKATLSAGYGQSEGCSNFTLPNPMFPLVDGCVGMPMPATTMAVFSEDLEELNYGEIGELCMTGPAMMLHYAGWRGDELTERTLINHPDGNCWLHTGDKAYINEHGIVYILGRGTTKRFGGGELYMMRMETKAVRVAGVEDGFFCFVPDQDHEGYFLPYLYVVLEDGYTIDDIREDVADALEDFEYPAQIIQLPERPFFHYKTNRVGLKAQLRATTN